MDRRVRRRSKSGRPVRLALVGLLLLGPFLGPLAGQDQAIAQGQVTSADLLARTLKAWRSHETIFARFSQVQHFIGFEEPLSSTGSLRILRPRYFELRFDPPHRQVQICDGEHVWTYVEESAQVFQNPLTPDAGRVADLLDWALEGSHVLPGVHPDTALGVPASRLDFEPGENLPLRELRIWVRPSGDPEPIGYEAVDTEGNRTRMKLEEVRYGLDWTPADFRFTVPDGVEVIQLGDSP